MQASNRSAAIPAALLSSVYVKPDPVEERGIAGKPKLSDCCAHRLACTLNRAFIMRRTIEHHSKLNNALRVN